MISSLRPLASSLLPPIVLLAESLLGLPLPGNPWLLVAALWAAALVLAALHRAGGGRSHLPITAMTLMVLVLPPIVARLPAIDVRNTWGAWKFAAGSIILLPAMIHLLLLLKIWKTDHPSPLRASTITALTFLLLMVPYLRLNMISGDEPHFTMAVDSIVSDGNLYFLEEHKALHHRRWIDSPLSDTQLLKGWSIDLEKPDAANADHSFAFPAWPLLTAPFYWISGVLLAWPPLLVRISTILPNLLLFFLSLHRLDHAAELLGGSRSTGPRLRPALVLFTPFVLWAQSALPEILILAVVSELVVIALGAGPLPRRIWFLALLAPWIHARAMPPVGLLLLMTFFGRSKRSLGPLALFALSFGLKLVFDSAYGLGYFQFQAGLAPRRFFLQDPVNLFVAYFGFLFDADCGLAVFFPLAALALIPGLAALVRPVEPRERYIAASAIICLGFPAMLDYWNSGYGIGRYQLSYLALLYPSILVRWESYRLALLRPGWKTLFLGTAAISFLSVVGFSIAQTVYANLPSGGLFTRFGIDLGIILPAAARVTRPEWASPAVQALRPWLALIWTAAYAALAFILMRRVAAEREKDF